MSSLSYLQYPSLSAEHLAFVTEDALWLAASTGGAARRLTAGMARVTHPCFSPDGRHLAFTSNADGAFEVYTMPVEGGAPRRLTYEGAGARSVGFTPDGRLILASHREAPLRGFWRLYTMSLEGGAPTPLPLGRALTASFHDGGDRVAVGCHQLDAARWKRYRGGTAGEIRVGSISEERFWRLSFAEPGNHVLPTFVGERVWFISDFDGFGNLWSCLPDGGDLQQHTRHRDHYLRHLRAWGQTLVYQRGARLFRFDAERAEESEVVVSAPPSGRDLRRRIVDPEDHLQEVTLCPGGKRLAASVRGKGLAMKAWSGPTRRFGPPSGVRLRLPTWVSEEEVVFVSDEGGEETPVVYDALTGDELTRVEIPEARRIRHLVGHATERAFAVVDVSNRVLLVTLPDDERDDDDKRDGDAQSDGASDDEGNGEGRRGEVKIDALFHDPDATLVRDLCFSPCGAWLALIVNRDWFVRGGELVLIELKTGQAHTVNDPSLLTVHSPAFDERGPFLHVLSERTFNPIMDDVQFNASITRATRLYTYVLDDGLSPYTATWLDQQAAKDDDDDDEDDDNSSGRERKRADKGHKPSSADGSGDEGVTPSEQGQASEGGDGEGQEEDEDEPMEIHLEGLSSRLVCCPDIPPGSYDQLQVDDDCILFLAHPPMGLLDDHPFDDVRTKQPRLISYDLKTGELTTIMSDVEGFEAFGERTLIVADGELYVLDTGKELPKAPARSGPGRHSGQVNMARLEVDVVPRDEWAQMFHEAWRMQRSHFWTEGMADIDWDEVRQRYLPLLERVATRSELSDLLWELQGELGTSHAYEFLGDYPDTPHQQIGALGAALRWDGEGWLVDRVLQGDSWDPRSTSPLRVPGVKVRAGDRIVAVEGRAVTAERSIGELLLGRAGVDVALQVLPRDGGEAREVVVRPLYSEAALRYRDWVTRNRQRVAEASQGRLGYVHIPDMSGEGLAEFFRAWRSAATHEGVVVDARNNGGGFVSQLIIERLMRRVIGRNVPRYGEGDTYPADAVRGPIVALVDQFAGSDGDIFAHAFKAYQIGPLIGRRTWGGVIGINLNDYLADGTIVTQPEFATLFEGVGWGVENYGVEPDIEVDFDPVSDAQGRDPQLARAIEVALARLDADPVEDIPRPPVPTRRFE